MPPSTFVRSSDPEMENVDHKRKLIKKVPLKMLIRPPMKASPTIAAWTMPFLVLK